jgi:hypothetical protein
LPTRPTDGGSNPQNQIGVLTPWGFEGQGTIGETYALWDNPGRFANTEGSSLYTFLGNDTNAGPINAEPTSTNTIDKSRASSNSDIGKRMEQMMNQRKSEFGSIERK